jgi:NADPH:quinone reductase-like Zn-dependent oxidoreductase
MKAYIIKKYGQIRDIEQIDRDYPEVTEKDVLVKVKAAAINPADLKVITGKDGGKFIHSGKSPIGLGFDFSGVIEEVGSGVTSFKPGDEVFGFLPYAAQTTQGSFADYVVVKNNTIALKPVSISHPDAAVTATAAATAWQGLVEKGNIKQGHRVFINGASGGVGSYGVQLAKSFNTEVWGTCSAENIDYINFLGCDHALDYRKTSIKEMSGSFDIILDAVSNSSYGECNHMMAPGACYITLLPSLGFVTGKFRSLFSSKKCTAVIVKPKTEDLNAIAGLLENSKISSTLAETFPIDQLPQALEKFNSSGTRGKIGIMIDR